jgi:hypothetical protein
VPFIPLPISPKVANGLVGATATFATVLAIGFCICGILDTTLFIHCGTHTSDAHNRDHHIDDNFAHSLANQAIFAHLPARLIAHHHSIIISDASHAGSDSIVFFSPSNDQYLSINACCHSSVEKRLYIPVIVSTGFVAHLSVPDNSLSVLGIAFTIIVGTAHAPSPTANHQRFSFAYLSRSDSFIVGIFWTRLSSFSANLHGKLSHSAVHISIPYLLAIHFIPHCCTSVSGCSTLKSIPSIFASEFHTSCITSLFLSSSSQSSNASISFFVTVPPFLTLSSIFLFHSFA